MEEDEEQERKDESSLSTARKNSRAEAVRTSATNSFLNFY